MKKFFDGEYLTPEIRQFSFIAERGFEVSVAKLENPRFEQEIGW